MATETIQYVCVALVLMGHNLKGRSRDYWQYSSVTVLKSTFCYICLCPISMLVDNLASFSSQERSVLAKLNYDQFVFEISFKCNTASKSSCFYNSPFTYAWLNKVELSYGHVHVDQLVCFICSWVSYNSLEFQFHSLFVLFPSLFQYISSFIVWFHHVAFWGKDLISDK